MLKFAKECINEGIDTTLSVVTNFEPENYKIDVKECEKIAKDMGAKFRNREWIKEGY